MQRSRSDASTLSCLRNIRRRSLFLLRAALIPRLVTELPKDPAAWIQALQLKVARVESRTGTSLCAPEAGFQKALDEMDPAQCSAQGLCHGVAVRFPAFSCFSWQAPCSFAGPGYQRRPATTTAASRGIPGPTADAPWRDLEMAET